MRKKFIAGNWKMHNVIAESKALAEGVLSMVQDKGLDKFADIAVCPTFISLAAVCEALKGSPVKVGAQNLFWEDKGAFTGEVSGQMIKDAGAEYVIIGHSERRQYFGETDQGVNKKIKAAISAGLLPIVCVGEMLEDRDAGKTLDVVKSQLDGGFEGVPADMMKLITIAYEPVWAIGTGRTATPDQAQEVHKMIRIWIAEQYGADVADVVRIQYGGSVKPANARELLSQPDIDGALVGGASLKADDFAAIIEGAR